MTSQKVKEQEKHYAYVLKLCYPSVPCALLEPPAACRSHLARATSTTALLQPCSLLQRPPAESQWQYSQQAKRYTVYTLQQSFRV